MYGYSFKDAMLTAADSVANNLRIAQDIAGHASIANTMRYTPLSKVKDIFKVINHLVLTGVDKNFGKYDDNQVNAMLD